MIKIEGVFNQINMLMQFLLKKMAVSYFTVERLMGFHKELWSGAERQRLLENLILELMDSD